MVEVVDEVDFGDEVFVDFGWDVVDVDDCFVVVWVLV